MPQERVIGSVRELTKGLLYFLYTPITLPKLVSIKKTTIPVKEEKSMSLKIEGSICKGVGGKLSVDGRDFSYDENTCIVGNLEKGAVVRVKLAMVPGQGAYATSIIVTKRAAFH